MVGNPSTFKEVARLIAMGMQPNLLGMTCASMLIICGYTALYDHAKFWKLAAYGSGTACVVLILYSGSRGAALMGFIGCFVLALPLVKRPGLLVIMLMLCVVPILVMVAQSDTQLSESAMRFTEEQGANRDQPWRAAIEYFRERPLMGQGWVYHTGAREAASANMHSIYLQVLAEMGIVGMVILVPTLLICFLRGARTWYRLHPIPAARHDAYYGLALVSAVLVHGLIESATLKGDTPNAVILGLGIGLFDRLVELADQWAAAGAGEHETHDATEHEAEADAGLSA